MEVTIADNLFLQYAKTAKLGAGNAGVGPSYFEWRLADPKTARFVTDSDIKDAEGPGQVAWLLETFFLHPENYLTAMEKPFDYVLTHNSYFARNKGWLWHPHGGSFVDFKDWKVHEKSRDVSVLLSPKKQLRGHKLFHEVVEKFSEMLDVFGLEGYVDKMTALAPYRYSVIVEAERQDSFFSEKLIDCLAVGTIPVYWGCKDIGAFFDTNGIIQVEDIPSIGGVLGLLDGKMGERYYLDRLDAVGRNLTTATEYRIAEDWIYQKYPFLFGVEK